MPFPVLAALGEAALWVGATTVLKNFGKWVVKQAPGWIAHVAAVFGLYFFVTEPLTEFGLEWARNRFNGVPGTVLETLYYLDVDNYISAVFSAYAMRRAFKAVSLAKKTPTRT
jgi:hypothetical protein